MVGVTWRDNVGSLEMGNRCGVREFGAVLRKLRLFGQMVRSETEILGKAQLFEVPGQ